MCELPSVTGTQAIAVFERAGFSVVRISGSHHIMNRPEHRFLLSVPVHRNETLKTGTIRGLIRDAGMTVAQFVANLN